MTTAVTYENEIIRIFGDVFASMLHVCVCPSDDLAADPAEVAASVSFDGSWNGCLTVECSLAQAIDWTVNLMGIELPVGFDNDVQDALGEMANMVGGNLKAILPSGTHLGVPSVWLAKDAASRPADGYIVNSRVILAGSLSRFSATLLERVSW